MCSNRSRSLGCSLIDQDFIAFNTFSGEIGQRSFLHKVDATVEQLLQVVPHAEELQADGLRVVKDDEDVDVAQRCLLAAGKGAEDPCLQDGLRLWTERYLFLTSDVGHVGHEVATANEAEDGDAVVLVQDAQRAQHLA